MRAALPHPQQAFGAIASAMVWYASSHGIGLLPDSMSYLEAGRSLLREHRLLVDQAPMTHFPPLYPLLLAGAGLLGGDLLTSTRLLHCLIFGLAVGVVGGAVREASRQSLVATSLAMSCTLAVAGIVQIHVTALSEPAFLCLLVTGSLALDRYLRKEDLRWLVAAAMVAAAAGLTRYAGVCLILSMLAAMLILDRQGVRARLRSAAVFAAVSCAPLVLWAIRNSAVQGSAVDRSLAFHPPGAEALRTIAYTLSFWAWPTPNLPPVVRAGMAVAMATVLGATVVAAVGHWFRRNRSGAEPCYLRDILAIFALSYGPFLLTSRTFVDAHTNFDYRILSPILIACIVLGFARSHRPSGSSRGVFQTLLAAAWVAVAMANIPWTAHILIEGHDKGIGYAAAEWRESETLAFVNSLPPATAVYSNALPV